VRARATASTSRSRASRASCTTSARASCRLPRDGRVRPSTSSAPTFRRRTLAAARAPAPA
jgi:hypothetical protein